MHISRTSKSLVFITMGDPSGIGPEIIMKAMASPEVMGLAIFVIVGDQFIFESLSHIVKEKGFFLQVTKDLAGIREDAINIIDPGPVLAEDIFRKPSNEGSLKALRCLEAAVGFGSEENAAKSVLVTAPVSKERIAEISPGFVGHTEYLREADGADMVTMVLTGESMCVVPVTRHIPLGDVTKHINEEYLFKTLVQVVDNRELITGKRDPKIAVAALNPHAGEGGKIGTEEKEIIMPAIERAKKVYPEIEGPVPADVVFYKAVKKEYDIVVSMYHDQCLAPFKMLDFDSGVNVTLGLGYVRTSPDHGTAFDIAGKGIANPRSMIEAIKLAVRAVT